jgi:hypothetical protein
MAEGRSRRLGSPRPETPPQECKNRTPPLVRAAVASQHSCGERNEGDVRILRSRHAPTSSWWFYDHGCGGGSQGPHPTGGEWRAGTLWPSVSPLWNGQGRVLSPARLPTAEVPPGPRAVHPSGNVLDLEVAVSALRQAVYGLPTFSRCRGGGLSIRRYRRRPATTWGPSNPTARA